MHRGWENTLVGRAILSSDRLRLETNSLQRADALRQQVGAACPGLVHHRAREHSDPLALMHQGKGVRDLNAAPPEIPPEELSRAILEMKKKHYADWADNSLPVLGGKTPREAVRTKAGREQVDLLLKDCENHEAREPEGQRFDFSMLRRELKLST